MNKQKNNSYVIDILHIFIFCSFILSQPLYDILAQYGNFFVARGSKPVDIFILVLSLSILIPAFFALVTMAFGLVSGKLRRVSHSVVISLLMVLFVMQVIKKVGTLHDSAVIPLSVLISAGFTFFYAKKESIRSFVTILAPAILIFPVYFLFFTPVNMLAFPKKVKIAEALELKNDTPIVIIMFDELPLVALLDEENKIDPVRYPNFSAFSKDAYWFRNYSVNSPITMVSVPIVLSGKYINKRPIATVEAYPNTLFTLLGNSYDLSVYESTKLCPEEINNLGIDEASYKSQLTTAIMDLSVVYLYIVLPDELSKSLPDVAGTWGNFAGIPEEKEGDTDTNIKSVYPFSMSRIVKYYDLFRSIRDNKEKPSLHYFHLYFPHIPYQYYPSGRRYSTPALLPGLRRIGVVHAWGDNKWLAMQGYQRFLLQVGAGDALIGELIKHLKDIRIYDKALVILTSDHGIINKTDTMTRVAHDYYESDIMMVPLLMKLPYQKEGIINDENIEGIDVLPTIMDVLDIDLPWEMAGRSAFDKSSPKRLEKRFYSPNPSGRDKDSKIYTYSAHNESRYKASLERKLKYFGSGRTKPNGLYAFGPHSELIGKSIDDIENIENTALIIRKEQDISSAEFNISDDFFKDPYSQSTLPAFLSGIVIDEADAPLDESLDIAVAVNGIIMATTRSYKDIDHNTTNFYAIVPEESFKSRDNSVAFYIIREEEDGALKLLRPTDESNYLFKGHNTISYGTKTIHIQPGFVKGHVEEVVIGEKNFTLKGWAADVRNSRLTDCVVMFIDDRTFITQTTKGRHDIPKRFKNKKLAKSGFIFSIPIDLIKEDSKVNIVAISRGVASPVIFDAAAKEAFAMSVSTHPNLKQVVKETPTEKATREKEEKIHAAKEAKSSAVYNSIYESIKKKQKAKN